MAFKTSHILMGSMLLGGIAHLMIFQNGYWNDALWMSAILNMGIPIAIYKYLQQGKRMRRKARLPPKEF